MKKQVNRPVPPPAPKLSAQEKLDRYAEHVETRFEDMVDEAIKTRKEFISKFVEPTRQNEQGDVIAGLTAVWAVGTSQISWKAESLIEADVFMSTAATFKNLRQDGRTLVEAVDYLRTKVEQVLIGERGSYDGIETTACSTSMFHNACALAVRKPLEQLYRRLTEWSIGLHDRLGEVEREDDEDRNDFTGMGWVDKNGRP